MNLGPRAAVAVGAGGMSLMLLPWRVCAVWTLVGLGVEACGWLASRPQFLGRPITRALQLAYLATLVALIANWSLLAFLLWRTGGLEGSLCALVIWLSVMGFAQTFASRTPIGFAVCGVLPTLGMLAVVQLAPNDGGSSRWSILGFMMLAIAFAIAGARQTFAAGRKFDDSQQRLHDSEFQYRILADNISDIVGRTELSGAWRYISPSIEATLGYTPEEFRRFEHFSYVHPEDRPRVEARLEKLLADGGGPCTFEYRLFRKDGELSWLETSFTLIHDPKTGEPAELVSMSRDINHRKALEQELVEALQHAEAAVVAKADFLANMTHELRTPLNAIVGFSGLLKTSPALAERESRQARLISDASSTLLGVVNSVLDFSKLESGAFALDAQPFDPAEVVRSVAALVEDQARQRGLALTVRIADLIPRLQGDAPRLQQVVLNLLSNALKFTREGGVEVRVEAAAGAGDGRRLRVAVSDTGVGIAEGQLGAIFERFNQADASVSRTFGGTGLGLAISKQIVELMGGEIGVSSTEGEGSTFWFEVDLPLAGAAGQAAPDAEPVGLDRPIRLLLVEDVEVNRELVQAILEPFDIEIETAVNGAEAVEAVGRAAYDLVLMDVQMPVMDGMTATRRIRALPDPAASRLPIIAMTANILPEQVQRCLDCGMDAHMGKPISPGRLLELISAWSDAEHAAELRRPTARHGGA